MKNFLILFSLLVAFSLPAQQEKFIDYIQADSSMVSEYHPQKLSEIFVAPQTHRSIAISFKELNSASQYDFSKLANLTVARIILAFPADTTQALKDKFIAEVDSTIRKSNCFLKCPKLKGIIFEIGEDLYVPERFYKRHNSDRYSDFSKLYDKNQECAWEAFGRDLSKVFPPSITLFVDNNRWMTYEDKDEGIFH